MDSRASYTLRLASCFCLALGTTALYTQPCKAQSGVSKPSAPAKALSHKTKYQQAQELFDKKAYAEALVMFRAVAKTLQSPNAMFMAARCLRALERWVEAWRAMGLTIDLAEKRLQDAPRYLQTRDAAAAQRQLLTSKIARLTLAVAEPPDDLTVVVNGRVIPLTSLGKVLGLAPGTLEIEATATGYRTFRKTLSLSGGANETLVLNITPMRATNDSPIQRSAPSTSPLVVSGAILGSIGLLGFGTFAVAGAMANKDFKSLEEACQIPPCTDPRANELADRGELLDLTANIGLGVGIAGVAVGTSLLVIGSLSRPSTEIALRIGPGSLSVRGVF